MQAYDLIMLIVLGMSTIFGAIKGLAWQVASLASIIVSYIVAFRYRFQVAEMIDAKPPWNMFLAMLILFVGTSFVIWVAFKLMSGMIDRIRLKDFDRHLGAVFGFGKGLIFCLLITMFAMTLLGPSQQSAICQSRSGYYITVALNKGVGVLPGEIRDVIGPYLDKLDQQLNQHRTQPQDSTSSGWANSTNGLNLPDLNFPNLNVPSANQPPAGVPGFNAPVVEPSNYNSPPYNSSPSGYPGLGNNDFSAPANSQPSTNGLRPTGNQAQQPGGVFPR